MKAKSLFLFALCACGGAVVIPESGPTAPVTVEGATPADPSCSAEADIVDWHPEYDYANEFAEIQVSGPGDALGCTFSVRWQCDTKDPAMTISCAPDGSQPLLALCTWPNEGGVRAFGMAGVHVSCSCTDLATTIAAAMKACGTES